MSKVTDRLRKEYDNREKCEEREDELEKCNLEASISNTFNKIREMKYESIKEEIELLRRILSDYEKLKYYVENDEFEKNEEEIELLKYRIEKLNEKQAKIQKEMENERNKNNSCDDWKKDEEFRESKEGEERE